MTPSGKTRPVGSKARAVRPTNLIERRMTKFMREPPSVRLAASVIVTATSFIVVAGGVLMRVFDHSEYGSVWLGMWWILQTVTTVGYGDYVPNNTVGKLITAFVMLEGIAFLSIVTAGITSVFVARAERERAVRRRCRSRRRTAAVSTRLDRVDAQLAQLHSRAARALLRTDPGGN